MVLKMRILIEQDDGAVVEAREIESVPPGSGILIFFGQYAMKNERMKELEEELSKKTGKICIILPAHIDKVIGIQGSD